MLAGDAQFWLTYAHLTTSIHINDVTSYMQELAHNTCILE